MIPAEDRHLIGAGVGYSIDNWTVDLAYTYIIAESVDYDDSVAPGVLDGKSKNGVTHIGALTVSYAF
jgi:long-chain fatty acid transport protein